MSQIALLTLLGAAADVVLIIGMWYIIRWRNRGP